MIETLAEAIPHILESLKVHKDAIEAGATLAASISFGFGVLQYRHTQRLRRAEWLHTLYTSFYEGRQYRYIRELVDGRHRNAGEPALHAVTRLGKESELDDYLNFFEFIAGLRVLGQMRRSDALSMFEYWIQRLKADQQIVDYVNRFGYENLSKLLVKTRFGIRHLFVYGTLMSSTTLRAAASSSLVDRVKTHWRYAGTGFINGRLYDLGRYPGAVVSPSGGHHVFGEIYEVVHEKALFRELDKYEGTEYARVPVDVYIDESPVVVAWCYTISAQHAEPFPYVAGGRYIPSAPELPSVGRLT